MYVPLEELSPANAYFLMTQTIIPRPIAWVLSENETGTYNLAPFSYFNAVSSDPAVFMLSVGKNRTDQIKTRIEILLNVNISPYTLLTQAYSMR